MSISEDLDLIPLAEAAKLLPGKPHISTLHRWRVRGVRGVKLPTLMCGGRRCVARSALFEFINATTAVRENSAPRATPRSRNRSREVQRAEQRLAKDGVA